MAQEAGAKSLNQEEDVGGNGIDLRRLALSLVAENPTAIGSDDLAALLDAEMPFVERCAEQLTTGDQQAFCGRSTVAAAIELGRRLAEEQFFDGSVPEQLSSSAAAAAYCRRVFHRLATNRKKEEMHVVTLDTKNRVIGHHPISTGTLDASLVHPRELFRPAILDSASSIIMVHNHPSGDPTPSREDFRVTRRIEEAGKILGIDVLDHIVVAKEGAISIRESGI